MKESIGKGVLCLQTMLEGCGVMLGIAAGAKSSKWRSVLAVCLAACGLLVEPVTKYIIAACRDANLFS